LKILDKNVQYHIDIELPHNEQKCPFETEMGRVDKVTMATHSPLRIVLKLNVMALS
jgi:hypothetical protein